MGSVLVSLVTCDDEREMVDYIQTNCVSTVQNFETKRKSILSLKF